ncbi:MAG: oxygenase MpaB family protein [Polyangiaceae bacterium]
MTVSREDLEAAIARMVAEIEDPRAGLFGPGSIAWAIDREAINFLCGGRAALLQLAHPFVAQAIADHSSVESDPLRRFKRTFAFVYDMLFGDLDQAIASARRVHRIHTKIEGALDPAVTIFPAGTRYRANDEESLLWVYATLHDSSVLAYETVVRPLDAEERARYLRESHRFALLFGIPERLLFDRWRDFADYNARMWSWLEVTPTARGIAEALLTPRAPALRPMFRWYRIMTAGLLPPPIREGFGLPFTDQHRRIFQASLRSLRLSYRLTPARLRHVPAHAHAVRRLAGGEGPDRLAAWLERRFIDTSVLAATRRAARRGDDRISEPPPARGARW